MHWICKQRLKFSFKRWKHCRYRQNVWSLQRCACNQTRAWRSVKIHIRPSKCSSDKCRWRCGPAPYTDIAGFVYHQKGNRRNRQPEDSVDRWLEVRTYSAFTFKRPWNVWKCQDLSRFTSWAQDASGNSAWPWQNQRDLWRDRQHWRCNRRCQCFICNKNSKGAFCRHRRLSENKRSIHNK